MAPSWATGMAEQEVPGAHTVPAVVTEVLCPSVRLGEWLCDLASSGEAVVGLWLGVEGRV